MRKLTILNKIASFGKKKLLCMILIVLYSIYITGCSNETPSYVGKYKSGSYYVDLRENGTFVSENVTNFEGKYSLKDDEVLFEVTKFAGKDFKANVKGKLSGKKLAGPDKINYTKDESK